MSTWGDQRAYIIATYEAEVRAAGLGDVWDHALADTEGAAATLLLGTIGSLARYMSDAGLVLAPSP